MSAMTSRVGPVRCIGVTNALQDRVIVVEADDCRATRPSKDSPGSADQTVSRRDRPSTACISRLQRPGGANPSLPCPPPIPWRLLEEARNTTGAAGHARKRAATTRKTTVTPPGSRVAV
jgi:hypothetical protein